MLEEAKIVELPGGMSLLRLLKAGKAYQLRLPKRSDWQVESAALLTLQGAQFAALQGCFPRRLPFL